MIHSIKNTKHRGTNSNQLRNRGEIASTRAATTSAASPQATSA
jgi:hypothetical protein